MRAVVLTLLTLLAASLAHAEHSSAVVRYRLEQLPHRPRYRRPRTERRYQ
jgi:hypothetical protein